MTALSWLPPFALSLSWTLPPMTALSWLPPVRPEPVEGPAGTRGAGCQCALTPPPHRGPCHRPLAPTPRPRYPPPMGDAFKDRKQDIARVLPAAARGVGAQPRRKRGGRPGNQNGRKHGFYSPCFSPEQADALEDARNLRGFAEDIAVMRLGLAALLRDPKAAPGHIFKTFHVRCRMMEIQRRYRFGRPMPASFSLSSLTNILAGGHPLRYGFDSCVESHSRPPDGRTLGKTRSGGGWSGRGFQLPLCPGPVPRLSRAC